MHEKPPPYFDRDFLTELAGGAAYRRGGRLEESGAVAEARWESPVLKGAVRDGDALREPALNLRSTVFAENRCDCAEARAGKVCAHAVAVALRYRRTTQDAVPAEAEAGPDASGAEAPAPPEPAPEAESGPSGGPCSLRTDPAGERLRLLVLLPPNLEDAAARDAVMVKFDAAIGRRIGPLNTLSPQSAYAPDSEAQSRALVLIEGWCGGKLPAMAQLSVARLRELLDTLWGEPVVYWLKRPDAPIPWGEKELPGVHNALGSPETPPTEPEHTGAARPAPVAEGAHAARSAPGPPAREPAAANPRRRAEAQAADRWAPAPGDYPAAEAASGAMDQMPADKVVVDGSLNFLAIRLPAGNAESVRPLRELLKAEGFRLEPANRKWWLRDRHKTLNFLAAHWTALEREWGAVFTENFRKRFARAELSKVNVAAEESGGRFALRLSLSENTDETELRRAIAGGRRYVETGKGVTLLDADSLERMHSIEKAVSGQADRPFTPTFAKRLDTAELADVEALLEDVAEGWQPPEAWRARSRALKQVGALEPAPVRPGFDAVLRTYQRIGVAWLWHLYRHGLGGILADEMGLGKTLQALALIECVRSDAAASGGPALVVCPASIVENWAREAARFVPALRVVVHHGQGRATEPVALESADLVLTSYGTLRQDADLLATLDWCVAVGDEAQHIKNRRTRNAKALARVRSGGRFLLTGTPVENSLDDLLSLFAFLMPGYLEKAPANLAREDREWHDKRQTHRAAPYILRRTKREVAPELPEKIERTFFCKLGARQERFYRETLERTRREIFEMEMAGAAAGRLRMAAFTELLRLRQACVDPRIIDEAYPPDASAKLGAFEELLDECLDAGGRMLVFSSFVSALKLLAERLGELGHRYCYLDGSTRDRMKECDRFNNDSGIPVFLISLKAGGTGLNLAGADTVLHYDPWWNPAAEAQATDRAHRIGQTRVVTSIKLIAAETVEEKVLELQARKAGILRELFEESEAANAKVSLEDIKSLLE